MAAGQSARLHQRILVVEPDGGLARRLRTALQNAGLDARVADCAPPDPEADAILANAEVKVGACGVLVLLYRAKTSLLRTQFALEDARAGPPLPAAAFGRLVRARLRPAPLLALPAVLTAGGLRVDSSAYRVYAQGTEVKLTALELRLLSVLLAEGGRVLTREDLLERVWGIVRRVDTRTVDTHIKRMRRKLGPCARAIETARRFGYRVAVDAPTADTR